MSIKCVTIILAGLLCSQTFGDQSNEFNRKGKFFGITGYLSGKSNKFPPKLQKKNLII